MSLYIKRAGGQQQKIAGHTIILDANASEIRKGTFSISGNGWHDTNIIFTDPMPDIDYIVIPTVIQQGGEGDLATQWTITNKTTTGCTISYYSNLTGTKQCEYVAFKLIPLIGYTELQNKVSNPDNAPTEGSENLVKSGGVWEAIKNASSVFVGTEAGWEAADHTKWDIAVLTDKHMILSVNRTSGESTEQANLDKVFDGTQAEWDALTDEQRDYYDHAMIKTNTYAANPGTLIVAHDMTVATGDWTADDTYTGFGYKADISVADVTAKHSPEVRFSFTDASSGMFAGIADCADGKVTIYANAVPADDVTIPVIICTLMEV